MQATPPTHSMDQPQRPGQAGSLASRSASYDQRTRSEDSWVELSSQPSSSSLSSANEDVITTGLRVQHDVRARRRRLPRHNGPSHLNISYRPASAGGTSSQEEYEESESESDRVMTSSGEGPVLSPASNARFARSPALQSTASEDSAPQVSGSDDEQRTAINYPIRSDQSFTPQPNAFSHPPNSNGRHSSQPAPGSYFPHQRQPPRGYARHSMPTYYENPRQHHLPQTPLSPSYNIATRHDEALRTSLTTLLSCAAAARGLPKADTKRQAPTSAPQQQSRSNHIEPGSLRLVPESALVTSSPPPPPNTFNSPTFNPTLIRQDSTTTDTSSGPEHRLSQSIPNDVHKRRSPRSRSTSRTRLRALKKSRRCSSASSATSAVEDLTITPTLLTWVVSAGVVVMLSAISFGAGYGLGKEAGRLEAWEGSGLSGCAREARSGMGIKRNLARGASALV